MPGPAVDPRVWAAPGPSGIRRYVPVLTWLPAYHRGFLRFDLIAGATIWGLLVPESIAYAGLAGLPPEAGLYTLLATLAAYAIFGTSRQLVAGATSAAAVLIASGVAAIQPAGAEEYAAAGAAMVIFCGLLFLVAGFLRLGFVAQFLSVPVMAGFIFGLAIFVTVKQLPKLFGIEGSTGDTIRQFVHLLTHLDETSWLTLAIGVSALALLFGLERFAPKVPGGLIALLLGIVISGALDLSQHGVAIVGDVPSGLPSLGIPDISRGDVAALMVAAAGMLLVVFSESLGAAETFAAKHGYEIDPNQELIALGVANVGSGLVGGLAGGGSLSQSAVNDGAGARSEVSPLFASVLVVITVLFLTPLFKNLPEAVLAALIIFAVSHLWKIREFKGYFRISRVEFWLGIATMAGVITFDVLPGLLIGVVSMLILFIYHASTPHVVTLGRIPDVPGAYGNLRRHPEYEAVPGLLVLRLDAPLFYANSSGVGGAIKRLVGAADPLPHAVIVDAGVNDSLDITSETMLARLVAELRSAGIDFALAEARHPVTGMARRSRLLELLGKDGVFDTVEEAVTTLEKPGAGSAAPIPA